MLGKYRDSPFSTSKDSAAGRHKSFNNKQVREGGLEPPQVALLDPKSKDRIAKVQRHQIVTR